MASIIGCSVTQRVRQVKQPRGGYINPKIMEAISMGDGIDALNPEENVNAGLTGMAVEYLTRYMSGTSIEDSFYISMLGASRIKEKRNAQRLMAGIKGLDNKSIICAVKLSGYDVCYRTGGIGYRPIDEILPDYATITNIRIMVERSLNFLEWYGPKILDGFEFTGGYTDTVMFGDGDFIIGDTLWDFKVSKLRPKKEHTLQLLMYWRMGLHSIHLEFNDVKYIGIYNPRTNIAYRLAVDKIPADVISEVEYDVIGYKNYRAISKTK